MTAVLHRVSPGREPRQEHHRERCQPQNKPPQQRHRSIAAGPRTGTPPWRDPEEAVNCTTVPAIRPTASTLHEQSHGPLRRKAIP